MAQAKEQSLTCISRPWGHFSSWNCSTFQCQLGSPASFIRSSSHMWEAVIWSPRLPFETIASCATLNKDEQLICWLFQKHSLMIASWNWLGQEFYAKYPCLWRMGTGNDSGPQQSKELIISLKSTNLRCCIGCMQINTFFKSIFAKTSWYFLTVCSSNAFLTSAFWGLT